MTCFAKKSETEWSVHTLAVVKQHHVDRYAKWLQAYSEMSYVPIDPLPALNQVLDSNLHLIAPLKGSCCSRRPCRHTPHPRRIALVRSRGTATYTTRKQGNAGNERMIYCARGDMAGIN